MGCGFAATASRKKPRIPPEGRISKEDFVVRKSALFSTEYSLERCLGNGTYAEVWEAKNKFTHQSRAVKIIKKSLFHKHPRLQQYINTEIIILARVDSPNVMKIYEIYEDELKYYIVIELMCGKSLYEYIADLPKGQLTEAKVAGFMGQILSGLNCCHMQGIAHRDIKPENLMFSDKECTNLKLIDFGFARFFKEGECKFREILGSPMYMAPEILSQKQYNEKCDLWSCGILCYTLLCGNVPFRTSDDDPVEVLFEHIKAKTFTKEDLAGDTWKHISDEAKDFVLTLLRKEPSKRPAAHEMLHHPWLSLAKDEHPDVIEARKAMERLLNINVFRCSLDIFEERQRLTKVFKGIDKDNNHIISREELKKAFAESGITVTDAAFNKLFARLDTDKSGSIDYTEFLAGAIDISLATSEKNLLAAFNFFDKDKNGTIDKEEIRKATKTGWISEVQLAKLFDDVDSNGDQQISFPEFKQMMEKIILPDT